MDRSGVLGLPFAVSFYLFRMDASPFCLVFLVFGEERVLFPPRATRRLARTNREQLLVEAVKPSCKARATLYGGKALPHNFFYFYSLLSPREGAVRQANGHVAPLPLWKKVANGHKSKNKIARLGLISHQQWTKFFLAWSVYPTHIFPFIPLMTIAAHGNPPLAHSLSIPRPKTKKEK
ncbi:hypothetical protein BC940DRAFT_67628 [Gongronella butleri]|nr:hypothetical protein BC940DRAFT_67628 [Gongronella butleri]